LIDFIKGKRFFLLNFSINDASKPFGKFMGSIGDFRRGKGFQIVRSLLLTIDKIIEKRENLLEILGGVTNSAINNIYVDNL
jgi:hypothetical protein